MPQTKIDSATHLSTCSTARRPGSNSDGEGPDALRSPSSRYRAHGGSGCAAVRARSSGLNNYVPAPTVNNVLKPCHSSQPSSTHTLSVVALLSPIGQSSVNFNCSILVFGFSFPPHQLKYNNTLFSRNIRVYTCFPMQTKPVAFAIRTNVAFDGEKDDDLPNEGRCAITFNAQSFLHIMVIYTCMMIHDFLRRSRSTVIHLRRPVDL